MLRLAPLVIMITLPAFAEVRYIPMDCTLTLMDCGSSERNCPKGLTATMQLRSGGDFYLLSTVGVNNIQDPSGHHKDEFFLNVVPPGSSPLVYFIEGHPSVDGALAFDQDLNAKMHVVIKGEDNLYDEYFEGKCVEVTE